MKKLILIIIMTVSLLACTNNQYIETVKNDNVGIIQTTKFSDVIENYCTKTKWKHEKSNEKNYVTLDGNFEYNGEKKELFLRYLVENNDYSIDSIKIDGESKNKIVYMGLLATMYAKYLESSF